MVGIILLKDIQSGSYTNLNLMVFNGNSYSDLDPVKPSSLYVINTQSQKIVSKNISSEVKITYFDLISLVNEARNFLVSNPNALCVQFKYTETNTEFRIIPTSQGDYALPDLYNFIYGSGVYYPLKTFTFKTKNAQARANPLEADVCCTLLNYALQSLEPHLNTVYYQAGGTLYVDLSAFVRNPFFRGVLKNRLSAKTYRLVLKLYKQRVKQADRTFAAPLVLKSPKPISNIDVTPAKTQYEELINKLRASKLMASVVATAYFADLKPSQFIKNIFDIANDPKLTEIKDSLYIKMLEYGRKLFTYKCIPREDYVKYLSVYDIMTSEFDANLRKSLSLKSQLLRYSAIEFDKRERFIIAFDGTAYEI